MLKSSCISDSWAGVSLSRFALASPSLGSPVSVYLLTLKYLLGTYSVPSLGRTAMKQVDNSPAHLGRSLAGIRWSQSRAGDLIWSRSAVVSTTESVPREVGPTWFASAVELTGRLTGGK